MKLLAAVLLFASTAFAGETTITCPTSQQNVALQMEPNNSSQQVSQIACGARVWAFEGQTAGWSKVRAYSDGKEGFVPTASLAAPPPFMEVAATTPASPAPAVPVAPRPAPALQPQDVPSLREFPRGELFAGYSLLSVDTDGTIDRPFLHGFAGQFTGNVNEWFGISVMMGAQFGKVEEQAVSGLQVVDVEVDVQAYGAFVAPEFSFRSEAFRPFIHTGFGITYLKASNPRASTGGLTVSLDLDESSTDPAAIVGGGFDINAGALGVRPVQFDYILGFSDGAESHNFRLAAGVVFRF